MSRRLLLLDIDGTISPLHGIRNDDYIIVTTNYTNWTITFETIDLILDCHEQGVETIWASAWEEISNKINKTLEISPFQHIKFKNHAETVENILTHETLETWFKEETIKNFITENLQQNSRIVFADDEISDNMFKWAETFENLKLLKTVGTVGLNAEECDEIRKFLEVED